MGLLRWLGWPYAAPEPYRGLMFEVRDYRDGRSEPELVETIGDLAVPVGTSLAIWDATTGRLLEFELTAIEAVKGDVAVARFIAYKSPRPGTVRTHFRA